MSSFDSALSASGVRAQTVDVEFEQCTRELRMAFAIEGCALRRPVLEPRAFAAVYLNQFADTRSPGGRAAGPLVAAVALATTGRRPSSKI
jgi:hypothetical protein